MAAAVYEFVSKTPIKQEAGLSCVIGKIEQEEYDEGDLSSYAC